MIIGQFLGFFVEKDYLYGCTFCRRPIGGRKRDTAKTEDVPAGTLLSFLLCIDMKTSWIILSLVFGLLFFVLGCVAHADLFQYFGAIVLTPGLIGFLEKFWPEGK